MRRAFPDRSGMAILALICALTLSAGCLSSAGSDAGSSDAGSSGPHGHAAPDFPTSDPELWINSPPLSMSGLRGQVVLIDVWTFG